MRRMRPTHFCPHVAGKGTGRTRLIDVPPPGRPWARLGETAAPLRGPSGRATARGRWSRGPRRLSAAAGERRPGLQVRSPAARRGDARTGGPREPPGVAGGAGGATAAGARQGCPRLRLRPHCHPSGGRPGQLLVTLPVHWEKTLSSAGRGPGPGPAARSWPDGSLAPPPPSQAAAPSAVDCFSQENSVIFLNTGDLESV